MDFLNGAASFHSQFSALSIFKQKCFLFGFVLFSAAQHGEAE
jgi:hypothetical protein